MFRFYLRAGVLLALLAAPLPAQTQRALTTTQWRADLQFLATELPKRHRNAFHKIGRTTFDSAVAALNERLPTLNDHQAAIGLASIVALIGDGHTRMALPQDPAVGFDRAHTVTEPPTDSSLFMHHLPVKLALFPEGLFVRAAVRAQRDLIGARVLRIGRMSADSALEAIRPVVNYDNEQGFRFIAPTLLPIPEVLEAFGVAATARQVELVVERTSGERATIVLEPVPLFGTPEFIEARSLLVSLPMWERNIDDWYWLQYLTAERTVYVQYNRVGSSERENITDFARRIREVFADSGAQKVVIDLRHNGGGDGNMARPMLAALTGDSMINRFGRLFILIGRETYSAAQMFVNDLEHVSNALFVGEATGASPSSYGDSRKFRLPHSGMTVRASTIYWRDATPEEQRPATPPDLHVALTAADYFAGRDSVLAEVMAFDANLDGVSVVRTVQKRGGWPQAMRVCWRHGADIRLGAEPRARGMAECGVLLQEQGHADIAAQWFQAMVNYLPDEPRGYRGLSAALRASGKPEQAAAAASKAAALEGASL